MAIDEIDREFVAYIRRTYGERYTSHINDRGIITKFTTDRRAFRAAWLLCAARGRERTTA